MAISEWIPHGEPRDRAAAGLRLVFAGVFLWLRVLRVRAVHARGGSRRRGAPMTGTDLLLMLAAYASVDGVPGVTATTKPNLPGVGGHDAGFRWLTLARCICFSVATTLTTVGSGDSRPAGGVAGVWRVVVGSQALLEYLVPGVPASTATNPLQTVEHRTREETQDEAGG